MGPRWRRVLRLREHSYGTRRFAVLGRLARGDVGCRRGRFRREPHRGWACSSVRVARRRLDPDGAGPPRDQQRRALRRNRIAVRRRRASGGGVGRGFRDRISMGSLLPAVGPDWGGHPRRRLRYGDDASVRVRRRRDSRRGRRGYRRYRPGPRARRGVPVELDRRGLGANGTSH